MGPLSMYHSSMCAFYRFVSVRIPGSTYHARTWVSLRSQLEERSENLPKGSVLITTISGVKVPLQTHPNPNLVGHPRLSSPLAPTQKWKRGPRGGMRRYWIRRAGSKATRALLAVRRTRSSPRKSLLYTRSIVEDPHGCTQAM